MSWDWEKLKEQQRKRGDIPPKMDDFLQKMNKFKAPTGGPLIIILIVLVIYFGSTMIYTVQLNEVGVVQCFGEFVRIEQPGLKVKWPSGIEKVTKVKVEHVYQEEFGLSSTDAMGSQSRYTFDSETNSATLMLTGDLNVAVVPWVVQYKISEPANYLFKVENVKGLLRDMSEASMRLVVGDRSINEVISKREEIAEEAKKELQAELSKAEAGILITTIEMKRTNVPEPVQPSFNEVNQATQEKEKLIYQANEEYNKAIPAARGEAEKMIKAAEGYALERVNRAKGDAARFTSFYNEYVNAKEVTKRRLYLETMRDVFPKMGQKYIIDSDQKNILPLLNLSNMNTGDSK